MVEWTLLRELTNGKKSIESAKCMKLKREVQQFEWVIYYYNNGQQCLPRIAQRKHHWTKSGVRRTHKSNLEDYNFEKIILEGE